MQGLAGQQIPAGLGYATILPDMDFETYSEAGYIFDEAAQKWRSISSSPPHGIGAVGAAVYAEHPSTEILSLAYDLKDGIGPRLWLPGHPAPQELFDYIYMGGGIIEAWNASFEFYIWNIVAVRKLGWPPLPACNLRDAMDKSRAFSMPGALEEAARAIKVSSAELKDSEGHKIMQSLSKPRHPTAKMPNRRYTPETSPKEFTRLYSYNIQDIVAEAAVSARCPDLSDSEQELRSINLDINARGVQIDKELLGACRHIVAAARAKYTAELQRLTMGTVSTVDELKKLGEWLSSRGHPMADLDSETLGAALKSPDIPQDVKRVIDIRLSIGSKNVNKLDAINRMLTSDGRLHDLFAYCGADRTGRFAGRGPQPQNLYKGGPDTDKCQCGAYHWRGLIWCPYCHGSTAIISKGAEWSAEAAAYAIPILLSGNLEYVESLWGDAIEVVSGVLRSLFVSAPGHDLVCSDYSAIEAVVQAMISGEEWRIEVFRTHGKIYEASASKITGIPFEEFIRHKKETGNHHPQRNKIGKYAELASGYQGWLGAWKNFGADKHLTDEEIKQAILAWREASPNIVAMWGGLETAAKNAVKYPGQCFAYREISYGVKDNVLYCRLPSGRCIAYHEPMITRRMNDWGREVEDLSYMGNNSDYKEGPKGWMRLDTYGGHLFENVVQAIARDILAYAMINLEKAGYPIVLHVHDEIAAEVPEGWGSVEHFEKIMSTMPPWAQGWPIVAKGGWRGKRYRKD